jgi:hypothetical protein
MALIDTGNSVQYHGCLRAQYAQSLNLIVQPRDDIVVGYASSAHNMRVEGVARFQMGIHINDAYILFNMVCLVITDLTDNLNLGSHFLKEYNVSLLFSKEQPLTLQFRDYGTVQSVDSISQNKSSIFTAPTNSDDHSQNLPLTIQNSDFHFLKGKVFKLKSSKQQFLSKNQVGQVKCYVDKAPPNNFCFLVLPASPFHTNTFEGIVKRVKSPNSQFF